MSREPIDIFIPWVDGNDLEWKKEKEKYMSHYKNEYLEPAISDIRFNDWGTLRYFFRAVEEYLPWFGRVFFVTCGHIPEWLNTSNQRLKVVNHREYIPEEYLPTFNTNVIQLNLFRIQELSENFILFNDDTFPLRPIEENYYFLNGTVCDEAIEGPIVPRKGRGTKLGKMFRINEVAIINDYFKKRECYAKYPHVWLCEGYGEYLERNKVMQYWDHFCGFRDPHMPCAYKKSSFKEVWDCEHDYLDRIGHNRFRDITDVTEWLVRYWQICKGDINPRLSVGKNFMVDLSNYETVARAIEQQTYPVICLNEACTGEQFEQVKKRIKDAFENILPKKSSFEK